MLTESEVLVYLSKNFPQKTIYPEEYKRTRSLRAEIHRFARAEGKSSVQWLEDHGFAWKEIGYLESDMRDYAEEKSSESSQPALSVAEKAFRIADRVFRHYPLAGEYVLAEDERDMLYQTARNAIYNFFQTGDIKQRDRVVLTLDTITLLKNWDTKPTEEESDGGLWRYVFQQYGFNRDKSSAASSRLYAQFQTSIKVTLSHYYRFFAPSGTYRYYATLLFHALSPKSSIESYFDILFDFYVNNLEFQYIEDDTSFRSFAKGMKSRWDAKVPKNDELNLKIGDIKVAQRILFTERPGYIAVRSDNIVRKMDALLRGDQDDINDLLDPKRNYWDALLLQWYKKKTSKERVQLQGARRNQKTEYVATSQNRIYAQYMMQDSAVGLTIPKIRLSEAGESRPTLRVYQDETCILEREMSVAGNDLCLTTRACFLSLKDTEYDFTQSPRIQVEIEYNGDLLYHSGKKLYRDFLVFDQKGNEKAKRSGTIYLFLGDHQQVEFPDGEEDVFQLPHPGQLYRINIDSVSILLVDGKEILSDAEQEKKVRHYTSVRRESGVCVIKESNAADVFSESFTLSILLPKDEPVARYQIAIDSIRWSVHALHGDDGRVEIRSTDDNRPHCIRVVDVVTGYVKHEYRYIVLQGFQIQFDKSIYAAGVEQPSAQIRFDGHESHSQILLRDGKDSGNIFVPDMPFQFQVQVPIMHCTIMGENAFLAPASIWHEDIRDSDGLVRLDLPDGWTGQVMLNATALPVLGEDKSCFETKATFHAMQKTQADAVLWLSLRHSNGEHIKRDLTTVAFQPTFLASPVEIVEDEVVWQPEGTYIGAKNSHFLLEVGLGDVKNKAIQLPNEDRVLSKVQDLDVGHYRYQIYTQGKRNLFAKEAQEPKLIYSSSFAIGDDHNQIYQGKELVLDTAMYWEITTDTSEHVALNHGSGVLRNFTYQGMSEPYDGAVPAPCYSAVLYYLDDESGYVPFKKGQSKRYQEINPVMAWIINEHLLVLQAATGDALYVDKRSASIPEKDPDIYMDKEEQRDRLVVADFFEYKIREERIHV